MRHSSFRTAGQSDHADRRQEIGTVRNILYYEFGFVISNMIIQEKLGQAFGICACEGIGADGTVFQCLFQSILFFVYGLIGGAADTCHKQGAG